MVELTVDELKLYMELDKKINIRAEEIAQKFNLSGGKFDSVYVGDPHCLPENKQDMIIIEMGCFQCGEYVPSTHYLTPEEFCLSDGKKLFDERIKQEYEDWKKEQENFKSKTKVYRINFGD